MDNTKHEETTHSDPTEPIVSWSGVQGETQNETQKMEVPESTDADVQEKADDSSKNEDVTT